MSLFFTAVFLDDDGSVLDRELHGPFCSYEAREKEMDTLLDDEDQVVLCPIDIIEGDEPNLMIPD